MHHWVPLLSQEMPWLQRLAAHTATFAQKAISLRRIPNADSTKIPHTMSAVTQMLTGRSLLLSFTAGTSGAAAEFPASGRVSKHNTVATEILAANRVTGTHIYLFSVRSMPANTVHSLRCSPSKQQDNHVTHPFTNTSAFESHPQAPTCSLAAGPEWSLLAPSGFWNERRICVLITLKNKTVVYILHAKHLSVEQ